MKFGKHLKENVHLPWADKYVSYKQLKKILKRFKVSAKAETGASTSNSSTDEQSEREMFISAKDAFLAKVQDDLQKVNQFFNQILDSSEKMLGIIRPNEDNVSNEAERAVQGALTELYLLKQYVALNLSGFRKIVVS
jgi:SPX domain protein involved in polyphosphate accumulation